jgi:hypothetical protein
MVAVAALTGIFCRGTKEESVVENPIPKIKVEISYEEVQKIKEENAKDALGMLQVSQGFVDNYIGRTNQEKLALITNNISPGLANFYAKINKNWELDYSVDDIINNGNNVYVDTIENAAQKGHKIVTHDRSWIINYNKGVRKGTIDPEIITPHGVNWF